MSTPESSFAFIRWSHSKLFHSLSNGSVRATVLWAAHCLLSVALLLFISISYKTFLINRLTVEWALRALIDFTLSNARRFYSSMGNALDGKGLRSSDESKPNLKCGQISITHCLAAFSYVIQNAIIDKTMRDRSQKGFLHPRMNKLTKILVSFFYFSSWNPW